MAAINFFKNCPPSWPGRRLLLVAAPITLSALCVYYFWKTKRRQLHIVTVETVDQWNEVEVRLRRGISKDMVVGLDCEWTTIEDKVGKVALLQLSDHNGVCALIRLPKFGNTFPDSLLTLLKDERILKVGVSIHNDAAKLIKDYGIVIRGYLDLAWLATEENGAFGLGLQAMSKRYLGIDINKSLHVRCSNWDSQNLTEQQKHYAATDAYVAVRIFNVLLNARQKFPHSLLFWKSLWWDRCPEIYRYTQIPFKHSKVTNNVTKPCAPSLSKMALNKSLKSSYSTRKSPLYDNCIIQAPDGQPLCTCDVRKVKWYVEKGLGDMISESPPVVRLRFEPSGRPADEEDYFLQPKENCCVVCGANHTLIRKSIVPQEYRRYFPCELKSHNSHDIVLLCLDCHQLCDFHDNALKLKLAVEYNAPLGTAANSKIEENPELKKVHSAARAVNITNIPAERRKQLEDIICQYYGVDSLTEETLQKALNLQTKFENKDYVPHGLKVVSQVTKNEGLAQFEKQWRKHFLEVMQPQFMPKSWSVDHRH